MPRGHARNNFLCGEGETNEEEWHEESEACC